MPEFTFIGTFTVVADDEIDARHKLNKCFPTSKKRLDEAKARYIIELQKPAAEEAKPAGS